MIRNMNIDSWSRQVAGLVVDARIDSGHISKDGFDSEEILVRLWLNDYPPPQESHSPNDAIQGVRAEEQKLES